ncbi:protein Shroom1 [Anolis carolinensis]|uniref:protein Shroom1 n=1 Tax=Anolis carolinensis TaxID=28377 RepID=UPI002F2B5B16
MSSYEHEVSRWSLIHGQGIEELLEPVVSPRDASRFIAEKPLGGIDQFLHIPGKADSAYSSFSGGSNLPEYPAPLGYTEDDPLPPDQSPYMDSGYVRGIYNPSAMNAELRQMYENKTTGKSSHYKLERTGHTQIYGSTPVHGMPYQTQSPLARFASPLPPPPSPPVRVDSYKGNRNVDQPFTICFDLSGQAEGYVQNPSKGSPFDTPADYYNDYWLSGHETESVITGKGNNWYPTHPYVTKKNNTPIFTKPAAMLEEKIRPNSSEKILWTQNTIHAYKIPEVMNSESFPSLQASHNAVNDTQENKQYFYSYSVHKPPFTEADLPGSLAGSRKPEGELDDFLHPSGVEDHSGLEQTYKCSSSLNYIAESLPNEAALRIIKNYDEKECSFSSDEENSRNVWHPLLKQQTRMERVPSHGLNFMEACRSETYETTNTVSCYKQDAEGSETQLFSGLRKAKENDNNSSPDLLMNSRQGETLDPVHFPNQHLLEKSESQSQPTSASIKINRKTTPLLYYLSGGKNSNFMTHKPHKALEQEDFSKKSPRSNCPVSAAPAEIPKDNNTCMDDTTSANGRLTVGSPALSVDDAFKNDYREKLKIAQSKVLRETSFKRKDLQMSLPIRLKPRPTSRPSIHHLRSSSLSTTNEDSKPIPPLKPLENLRREDESKRPQTTRIGGRKRATVEQKKISYSEPEKLNQLEDQRDQSASWKKKNARSRSDEISEQDTRFVRSKALESQGRALSKAELKQIQHNALLEYMERKTGQRPTTTHHSTQQKPLLRQRASDSKSNLEDRPSNSGTSRKLSNTDGFHQHPTPEQILEPLCFSSAITPASSLGPEMANLKAWHSGVGGSHASDCALEKTLLHSSSSVSSKGTSKSTSPVQDLYTAIDSTTSPLLSTQDHGYYPAHPSPLLKETLDVDQHDILETAKQGSHVAGRRGKSMEETESPERVRLPPLSRSTDQLQCLKGWHVSSGMEAHQSNQGANRQNILQNCESAPRCLPRQSSTEDTTSRKEIKADFCALEAPHSTNNRMYISLGHLPIGHKPLLSMGSRFPFSSIPVEQVCPSPVSSPGDTDNDVFKNPFASGSETASDIPSFHGQSQHSTGSRKEPEPVSTDLALQSSSEGNQSKEEQNVSFSLSEKEESNYGESGDDENSARNSHCSEMAPESSAFFLKEKSNTNSQLEKDTSEKSHVTDAPQWQNLEANDTTDPSENRTYYCTAPLDSQGHENTRSALTNSKALQNVCESSIPVQKTGSFMAETKTPEDQRCDDLAIEIIAKDKTLVDILMPYPNRKTVLDLMEGLFPVNISVPDRSCRWKVGIQIVQENIQRNCDCATDPFHGSENRKSLDDPEDITPKKRELISNIQLKLQALCDKRELLQNQVKEHAACGKELEAVVRGLCKPNEYERYLMFIGDLEKVVSLLLCLSSRLARVQNAMRKMDENTDAEEKHSLNERHRLLSRQREDAKDLKENLDRRERVVSGILSKYMPEGQIQDYRHFVQEKTSLLIEQKDLEEQITFLEEQLERLEKSILP